MKLELGNTEEVHEYDSDQRQTGGHWVPRLRRCIRGNGIGILWGAVVLMFVWRVYHLEFMGWHISRSVTTDKRVWPNTKQIFVLFVPS